jgi:hypothetical protein
MVGTPNNLAIRDLLAGRVRPAAVQLDGFPDWGDPENYPWTIGGILNYKTESELWCNYIAEEIGEGTTVAGLFMDNDFGNVYQETVQACADEGQIDLVESVNHDPAAPDVTSQITTIAASGARSSCSARPAQPARRPWRRSPGSRASSPRSSSPTPARASRPTSSRSTLRVRACSSPPPAKEPNDEDDPDVAEALERLDAAGLDPNQGAFFTGTIFGRHVEAVFRNASELEGGLNRVNLMRAVWSGEWENSLTRQGTFKTDGVQRRLPARGGAVRPLRPAGSR